MTHKPVIMMLPRFEKNFFWRMLYPELKIMGGRIRLKKMSGRN